MTKILGITYLDHITNDEVRNIIRQATHHNDEVFTTVKTKRKVKCFGHARSVDGPPKNFVTRQSSKQQHKRWTMKK